MHTPHELLGRVSAAEQIVGQAGPDIGNMRGGLVADATSGVAALVSGGLLCLGAVAVVGATTADLRDSSAPSHPTQPQPVHEPGSGKRLAGQRPSASQLTNYQSPSIARRHALNVHRRIEFAHMSEFI